MSDVAVARAIDELRRGGPLAIRDGGITIGVLGIETADEAALTAFEGDMRADLLVTHQRAALLHLVNQRPAAASAGAVRLRRAPWMDLAQSIAVADPVRDLAMPLQGPYDSVALGDTTRAATAALTLTKRAGLLPALFVGNRIDLAWLMVEAGDVLGFSPTHDLRIAARAQLPLEDAKDAQIIAFRSTTGGPEHLALIIGKPQLSAPVLVRLHSACLTGDLLGSLKCDCGPQLRMAIQQIEKTGGILLYLQQEGRGIGLINKLRAYALQDQGFDTVDANLRLGFEADERDFALAAKMLALLGVASVRLLTNNPAKVDGLETAGVEVVERVPHSIPPIAHNQAYLAAKRDRAGHLL